MRADTMDLDPAADDRRLRLRSRAVRGLHQRDRQRQGRSRSWTGTSTRTTTSRSGTTISMPSRDLAAAPVRAELQQHRPGAQREQPAVPELGLRDQQQSQFVRAGAEQPGQHRSPTGSSRATTGSAITERRSARPSRPSRSARAASPTPPSATSRSRSTTSWTRTSCSSPTTSRCSRGATRSPSAATSRRSASSTRSTSSGTGVFFLPYVARLPRRAAPSASLDEFFAATDPEQPDQLDFNSLRRNAAPSRVRTSTSASSAFYAQDEFLASERLNLTLGLRVDFPMYSTDPVDNPFSRGLTALDENGNPETVDQSELPGAEAALLTPGRLQLERGRATAAPRSAAAPASSPAGCRSCGSAT